MKNPNLKTVNSVEDSNKLLAYVTYVSLKTSLDLDENNEEDSLYLKEIETFIHDELLTYYYSQHIFKIFSQYPENVIKSMQLLDSESDKIELTQDEIDLCTRLTSIRTADVIVAEIRLNKFVQVLFSKTLTKNEL
jgi:hypothetical protein